MSVTDWASLQARVADLTNRTDLTPHMAAAVQMTEARLRRVLRARTVGPVAITLDADTVALPADCETLRSLTLVGGVFARPIPITSPAMLAEVRGDEPTPGVPMIAAVIDGSLHLAPTPSQAYAASITYYRTVPALTDATPTNWLLTLAPDVYVYGMLAEMYEYLMDPDAQARADARFRASVAELNVQLGRIEYGATPLGDAASPEYVF